jgi:pseudouridine-5'-phosphate glycosidase/pseudouridine kinase
LLDQNEVMLVSPVGSDGSSASQPDAFGLILQREMKANGMRTDGLLVRTDGAVGGSARTAVCNLILGSQGGLVAGVADMDIVEKINSDDVGVCFCCNSIYPSGADNKGPSIRNR